MLSIQDRLPKTLRKARRLTNFGALSTGTTSGSSPDTATPSVRRMRSIVRTHESDGGSLDALAELLTPELIGEHLYTGGQPDPDLVIRTSGEQRISDFMLWQSAHSEFYFMEALGPDLREVDFLRALRDFARRQRRFGQ